MQITNTVERLSFKSRKYPIYMIKRCTVFSGIRSGKHFTTGQRLENIIIRNWKATKSLQIKRVGIGAEKNSWCAPIAHSHRCPYLATTSAYILDEKTTIVELLTKKMADTVQFIGNDDITRPHTCWLGSWVSRQDSSSQIRTPPCWRKDRSPGTCVQYRGVI